MAADARRSMKVLSGGGTIALLLAVAGLAAAFYRMTVGLGATTNLSDQYPWGLWISFDVLIGVALAAGGFTITAAVYVFNWEKYRPIARPAVLTAFLGYILVATGLFFDIGKPMSLWHPLVMWQHTSVLFEVAWCVMLYLGVLAIEFAPTFLEGKGMTGLAATLRSKVIVYPLVIAGIILSFGHQSSLGALFLLSSAKLSHLWWSPIMHLHFYFSAICAGLAMVTFETILGHRSFKMEQPREILEGLARGTAIALLLYLAVRIGDLAMRGNLGLAFAGDRAGMLFLVEIVGGALAPMLLLFSKGVRRSVDAVLWVQILVLAGVVMNRFNATLLSQGGEGSSYFPTAIEFIVSVGLVSLGVLAYRWAVVNLSILSHEKAR